MAVYIHQFKPVRKSDISVIHSPTGNAKTASNKGTGAPGNWQCSPVSIYSSTVVKLLLRAVDYTILRHCYKMTLFDVQNQKLHQRSQETQPARQLINLKYRIGDM